MQPNPQGVKVAANRRVDVHLQRGAETPKPATPSHGSGAEARRLRAQNPRLTIDEAANTIVRLNSTTGTIPMAEWVQLAEMLNALDTWRRVDPTVPDLRATYHAPLAVIESRTPGAAAPGRAPMPPIGPISPEIDEALRKYEEAKKRLKDLKREREDLLRDLEEERKEFEEEERDME